MESALELGNFNLAAKCLNYFWQQGRVPTPSPVMQQKHVGKRLNICQYVWRCLEKVVPLHAKACENGLRLSNSNSLIAFDLHRPCRQKAKQIIIGNV